MSRQVVGTSKHVHTHRHKHVRNYDVSLSIHTGSRGLLNTWHTNSQKILAYVSRCCFIELTMRLWGYPQSWQPWPLAAHETTTHRKLQSSGLGKIKQNYCIGYWYINGNIKGWNTVMPPNVLMPTKTWTSVWTYYTHTHTHYFQADRLQVHFWLCVWYNSTSLHASSQKTQHNFANCQFSPVILFVFCKVYKHNYAESILNNNILILTQLLISMKSSHICHIVLHSHLSKILTL